MTGLVLIAKMLKSLLGHKCSLTNEKERKRKTIMLPLATVPSGLVVEMLILSLEWASALMNEKVV